MAIMLTKESFKVFLQKIVDKHLPDESIVFEIQADEIIEDTFNGAYQSSESSHGDKFGAVDLASTKLVIELIAIAFTSYKTIWEIAKLKKESKKIDLNELKEKWESKLKRCGIKSAKAKAITEEFIGDIEKLTK